MPRLYLANINTRLRLSGLPSGQPLLESYADSEHHKSVAEAQAQYQWALDCGAFSAYRRGKPIDLAKYIDYCLAHQNCYQWYLALDVIDGGGKINLANYMTMRDAGLWPVPVWHEGESLTLLSRYIEELDYADAVLAIGTQWPRSSARIYRWLDRLFTFLDKLEWQPRIHGLALVSYGGCYPFSSVDSREWASAIARLSHSSPWQHLQWPDLIRMYQLAVRRDWESQTPRPEQMTLWPHKESNQCQNISTSPNITPPLTS